jgi:HAD superfamily hydrolase (TIGR01484 family)
MQPDKKNYKTEVDKHLKNLLSNMGQASWINEDIIMNSALLVESISRYLIQDHMAKKGQAWPYENTLDTSQHGQLIRALKSMGVLDKEHFQISRINRLFQLDNIRNQVSHNSDPPMMNNTLKAIGISLSFLAESEIFDEMELPSIVSEAMTEARLKGEKQDINLSSRATPEQTGEEMEKVIKPIDSTIDITYQSMQEKRLLPFGLIPTATLNNIKLVAADIDDTVTIDKKITEEVLRSFRRLKEKQICTVLITGRSSGWGQAIINYMPGIDYIMTENGFVMFDSEGQMQIMQKMDSPDVIEEKLVRNAQRIEKVFNVRRTDDNHFKLYEITYDRPRDFTHEELVKCNSLVEEDIEVIASSIQIHIRPKGTDKAGALQLLIEQIGGISPDEEVLVIGDSANDAALFRNFPISVGVANILEYSKELGEDLPRFITTGYEGHGFLEVVDRLLLDVGDPL